MKHFYLLLCATLLAVAAPTQSARADVDVSIDFFFDALSPHGDWIYADDYGYVFQPAVSQEPGWAPYSDGYWAYTDAGWTWISNEDFGWATYHYGRWIRMSGSWVWVPGYEWAPAWVSWRQADDHIGWAPLPPEARWSVSIGFNQWTDSYYDVGPSYYNFVPFNLFARRTSLRPVIIDRSRNYTYIDRSVNITNISYRQNVVNNIFVGGPDPSRFDRGENRIRRLSLRRDDDRFRNEWQNERGERPRGFDSLSRIERDELIVAAPSIRRDNSLRLPSRVKERLERPEIDRGWRGSDTQAVERLRERQREEFSKNRPANLPDKAIDLVTSKVPPPAVGRLLKPEERRGPGQRPSPGRIDEEVRKAMPLGPDGKPRDPRERDGRPDVKDMPPTPGTPNRPGMPDRDGRPGDSPRDDRMPRDRTPDARNDEGRMPGINPREQPDRDQPNKQPDRPGMNKDDRPDRRPGMNDGDDRPDRRPGVKPNEAPRPRLAPGVVPNDEVPRRGGVPMTPPKTQDAPPAPKVIPKAPDLPKDRSDLPKVRPESPNMRPDRDSDTRRPSGVPSAPSNARPVPMPEPQRIPEAKPKRMPEPAAPKVKPAPMPKPEARPTPATKRQEEAAFRSTRPESRPAPQVKKPAQQPRPQVQQAAPSPRPEVKEAAPQPRPQVKQAAPQARPKPTPAKKPASAEAEQKRRER
ncbi:DUF6600 domain-containing protein [Prosthecobacter dejongeii]|uniref:YXWGXW repeat-containing protein n=1 Tax=Prosthecobacter dejongeii TaxID=48465 RepID=A0A7W7YNT6_9BACT|nr:DUF6600 domain-containing protein [Prosthecobacter dejongeii]MBB5039375.1 hypothetical protein [Prosthecobacter dejongeii]